MEKIWRRKDGSVMLIEDMTDVHLVNSIKMLARQWSSIRPGEAPKSPKWIDLANEARRRGFIISHYKTPTIIEGKEECVDVYIPSKQSKITAGFIPSELDSRNYD